MLQLVKKICNYMQTSTGRLVYSNMSLSPDDDLFDDTTVPTPKIKLEDEFINSQQEKMNVYLRIRPLLPGEILQDSKASICVEDECTVRAVAPLDSAKFKSSAHDNSALDQIFTFTRTFGPETDQIQFFEETMKSTLENFIQGQNELVFAYGSTGSGKTYTMQGGLSGTRPGVIPSTLYLLFGSIKGRQVMSPSFKPHKYSDVIKLNKWEQENEEAAREKLLAHLCSEDFDDSKNLSGKSSISISTVFSDDSLDVTSHSNLTDKEISTLESTLRMKNIACDSVIMQGEEVLFSIWVSFVEIYNENIYDLLEPVTSNKRTRLSLNEDKNKNIYVKGLREIRVTSSEEALKLFSLGKKNLRIASTKMNYQSSRSHCIFTIKIIRVLGIDSPLSARVNRLSYCDLAGSERTAKTQNTGMRLKEAGKINTSLLVLGRCIEALRQQGTRDKNIVPYRDSKLTRMFSAYFTGKGKASMIVNVSPASHVFDETLSVLKFSALAKQVTSNDLSIRPLSQWNKEISRLTETWEKSCSRWSSFCKSDSQKDSLNVISETSMEEENVVEESFDEVLQRDQLIEELMGHVKSLTDQLKKVMVDKENLETDIRAQVCREFAENFVQIDNCYREQLKDFEESDLTVSEHIHKELKSDVSKDADEEDNGEDSGDDEKEYCSADENLPSPNLSKAVESSESERLGDKGSQEKQEEELEKTTKSKDEDSDSLRIKMEENKLAFEKQEEKLEKTTKSKDEDSDALRIKMKENELAFEAKMKELENIINNRNDEICKLKDKFENEIASKNAELEKCLESLNSKAQDLTDREGKIEELEKVITSNEKKLQEFSTVLSLKEVEISFLKRSDESKEDALKNCELKDAEITELKKQIEKLQEDMSSKEKEIKDYKNTVSLKTTEVELLQEKIEENEVMVSNPALLEEQVKSSDESIAQLKKEVEDHLKSISLKDKELEECRNDLNSREKELSALRQQLEEHEVVVSKPEVLELEEKVKSNDESVAQLKKEIEDHLKSVSLKDKELEECRNDLNSKENELSALKQKLEEQEVHTSKSGELEGNQNSLNSWEGEITRLKKKIDDLEGSVISKSSELEENKNSLNSKEGEIMRLKKKIDDLEGSVISKDEFVKDVERNMKKTEEMLSSKSAEIRKLYEGSSCVEGTESENGRIKMGEKGSGKSEGGEMCLDEKKIMELQQKIASVDSAELSKAPEWQNVQCLTKLVRELSETLASQQAKLSTMEKKYDDLVEQVEEGKKTIQQEFNKKCEEKDKLLLEKSDEVKELQSKLDKKEQVLNKKLEEQEESLLERNNIIKELEHKLACKLAEEEKSKEQHIVDENQIKTLEQLVEVLQRSEFNSNKMASDLKAKVEELICKTKEREKDQTEERDQSEDEELSVNSSNSQNKILQHSLNKKLKHTTRQEVKRLRRKKAYKQRHGDEESDRKSADEEEGSYEAEEDSSFAIFGVDNKKPEKSTDFDTSQASFAESLVSCLQWIEMVAAQNIVKLNCENRNYCKKLLSLSEDIEVMRTKLAAAEMVISGKGNLHRKSKSGNFVFESQQEFTMGDQESLHLIETLQKIECISGKRISKLSGENLRLVHENKVLLEQVQASAADLDFINQESEKKDKEYCKIQGQLNKKEAHIASLESEVAKAQKKLDKLEKESKMQLLQEQAQHGIEVEQVVALKRQVETDYRSLERKYKAATEDVDEEPMQRRTRARTRRCKGRKRPSYEDDEDFKPSQKKRVVKSRAHFEDDASTCSAEAEQSHNTETSSFQRLHDFVEKSPVIRAVAQRVATFLSPKNGNESANSSTVKKRKRKLFNSAYAAPLITSPVQEAVRNISPKKTVNRKFRSKKDSK